MGEKIIDLVDEIYECNTREFDYGSKRIPLYLLLGLSFFTSNLFSYKTPQLLNKPKLASYSNINIENKNSHSLIPYIIEDYLKRKNIENLILNNIKIEELKIKITQIEPQIPIFSFYNSANLENILDSDLLSHLPKDPLAYKTHYLKQQFVNFKILDTKLKPLKSKPKKTSSGLREYDLSE